ncbi:hypothetical protein BJX70DRAFT_406069 [Aspergillus crustosus]
MAGTRYANMWVSLPLFHLTLDRKLHQSPLSRTAKSVLDIATGDPTWVHAFAETNPSISTVANDPNPTMNAIPPGINIIADTSDANVAWTYSQQFDFIHCRQHHRRLDEQRLFKQAFEQLSNPVTTSSPLSLPATNPLAKWGSLLIEASQKVNRPVDNPTKYETWMREAGFVNCQTVVYQWPTNPWPDDEKGKLMGLWNLFNVLQRFEEFSMGLLVRVLGWEGEDARGFLEEVKRELGDGGVHALWPVYVVYGQKPVVEATESKQD